MLFKLDLHSDTPSTLTKALRLALGHLERCIGSISLV